MRADFAHVGKALRIGPLLGEPVQAVTVLFDLPHRVADAGVL